MTTDDTPDPSGAPVHDIGVPIEVVADDVVPVHPPITQPGVDPDLQRHDLLAGRLLHSVAQSTDLHEFLGIVARAAISAVPGCDSASITVIHDGAATTVAASDDRALAVDEVQYADGDGPCLHAARYNRVVRVDDLTVAAPWRAWRQSALQGGITASLSMPLPTEANIAAALNLYTTSPSGWPADAAAGARLLATYATDAITLAYRINGRFADVHHISRHQVPRQNPSPMPRTAPEHPQESRPDR